MSEGELVEVEVLAREAGVRVELVQRLVAHGVVEPRGTRFARESVTIVARAARLQRDLELNDAGAALACELLTRIEELEEQLARLRRRG